jgi:hypothetical protein
MQFFIFLVFCLCGIASGVVYDIFYIARQFVCGVDKALYSTKDKIFIVVCDILYFVIFSLMVIFTAVIFDFYQIRLYMLAAAAIGTFIYLKSLHIFLAFFLKQLYNIINKLRRNRQDEN